MLEYFAYKKFKKNKAEKEEDAKQEQAKENASTNAGPASPRQTSRTSATPQPHSDRDGREHETPVLDDDDERFLERLTAGSVTIHDGDDLEGPKPPLPPRVKTPDLTWDSDSESFIKAPAKEEDAHKGKGKEAKNLIVKQANRLTLLLRRDKEREKEKKETKQGLKPHHDHLAVGEPEIDREKDDLTRVLDDLNLSARNNKAFSLSAESTELVQKFTVVLKDLVNGVPTAVNDLTTLLDDKDGKLAGNYEKLPKSMKKLVTQLPDKLSSTLAPELLAVAAEAQGLSKEDAAKGGLKGAAKRLLMPKSLSDIVTKPGAIVGMLKGIMNALKLRWPAFIGTNVIWSVALFLLLFVLWYCHKRGREVRLEREAQDQPIDGSSRIEELPDDPALPQPPTRADSEHSRQRTPIIIETPTEGSSSGPSLPRPPIGADRH